MTRHRPRSLIGAVTGFGTMAIGFVALAQSATAATPSISAACDGVTLSATEYDGSRANEWSVTIDGTTTGGTFGAAFQQTFPVPQDSEFAWSARIAAADGQYTVEQDGTLGPCVTTPTGEPSTTAPTTSAPPTSPTTQSAAYGTRGPEDVEVVPDGAEVMPPEADPLEDVQVRPAGPALTLPDTGAPAASATATVDATDQGMLPPGLARGWIAGGLALIALGIWQARRSASS